MFWIWCYYANKRAANYRHAMVGMPPVWHKALMRTFYPL